MNLSFAGKWFLLSLESMLITLPPTSPFNFCFDRSLSYKSFAVRKIKNGNSMILDERSFSQQLSSRLLTRRGVVSSSGDEVSSSGFFVPSVEEETPENKSNVDIEVEESKEDIKLVLEERLENENQGTFKNDLQDKISSSEGDFDSEAIQEGKEEGLVEAKERILSLQKELVDAANQHGDDVTELSQQVEDLYWKLSEANDKISDLKKELGGKKPPSESVGLDSTSKNEQKNYEALKNEVNDLKQALEEKEKAHKKELADLQEKMKPYDGGRESDNEEATIMKDGLDEALQKIALMQKQFEEKQSLKQTKDGNDTSKQGQETEKLKKAWALQEIDYKSKVEKLEKALEKATVPKEDEVSITQMREDFQQEIQRRDELLDAARRQVQELSDDEEQRKKQDNTYCELVESKEKIMMLEKQLQEVKSNQNKEMKEMQYHQEREIQALHQQLNEAHMSFARREDQYQNNISNLSRYSPGFGSEVQKLDVPSNQDRKFTPIIPPSSTSSLQEEKVSTVNSNHFSLGVPSTNHLDSTARRSNFDSIPPERQQNQSKVPEKDYPPSPKESTYVGQQSERSQELNNGDANRYQNSMMPSSSSRSGNRYMQKDFAPFDGRNAPPPPPQNIPQQYNGDSGMRSGNPAQAMRQESDVIAGPESRWSRWSSFGNIPFRYEQANGRPEGENHYTHEYSNNVSFQDGGMGSSANSGNGRGTRWTSFGTSPFHDDPSSSQKRMNIPLEQPPFNNMDPNGPQRFPENLPPPPMDAKASPDNHWSNTGKGFDPFNNPFSSEPYDDSD